MLMMINLQMRLGRYIMTEENPACS